MVIRFGPFILRVQHTLQIYENHKLLRRKFKSETDEVTEQCRILRNKKRDALYRRVCTEFWWRNLLQYVQL
jgi:hypothetical protein